LNDLSDLAKFSTTRSAARPLCDSFLFLIFDWYRLAFSSTGHHSDSHQTTSRTCSSQSLPLHPGPHSSLRDASRETMFACRISWSL